MTRLPGAQAAGTGHGSRQRPEEAPGRDRRQRPARQAAVLGLHLLALWSFAVAQPLFDLLAAKPDFFVARRSQPIDLVALALFLTLAAPLAPLALSLTARLAGRRIHRLVHGALVAALLTLILLPPINRWLAGPGWAPLPLAAALGFAGCWLYFRLAPLRQYATLLVAALVVFPAVFLLDPGIRKIVFPSSPVVDRQAASTSTTPLVLVIFDELPLVSLLDEERRIDPVRYPSFAQLAGRATWYPNATAVADYTSFSVPSIHTGRYPGRGLLPVTQDHPQNLFTLLAGSHELLVMETFTWLCPPDLCPGERPGFPARFRFLVSDLAVVYLHLVLPDPLRDRLPPIVQNWQQGPGLTERPTRKELRARNRKRFAADRGARFHRFVESIQGGRRPAFVYLHTSLPHAPWTRLPSGARYPDYGEPAWGDRGYWTTDPAAVDESQLRHLLQVGYVDRLLGELVGRLQRVGLYVPALLVVTSDHGMSFEPGAERRKLTPANLGEILSVPLIVKAPFQTEAIVDDRSFAAIDLLPTLADELGIRVPWEVEGSSIRDPATAKRRPVVAYRTAPALWGEMVVRPGDLEQRFQGLEKKLRLFGSGDAPLRPLSSSGLAGLVGLETEGLEIGQASEVRLELPLPATALELDAELSMAPLRLAGTAFGSRGGRGPLALAVAINGVVRAVTEVGAASRTGDGAFFSFLLDERSFTRGPNRAQFFVVERSAQEIRLRRATATFAG